MFDKADKFTVNLILIKLCMYDVCDKNQENQVNLIGSSVNMHVSEIFKEKGRFVMEESKDFFIKSMVS